MNYALQWFIIKCEKESRQFLPLCWLLIEVAVHVISASSEFRQCTYVKESILRNLKSLGNDRTFQSNKYVEGIISEVSVILFVRNSLLVFMKIWENLEKAHTYILIIIRRGKSGNQRNKLSHQFERVYVGQAIGSIFDRALT